MWPYSHALSTLWKKRIVGSLVGIWRGHSLIMDYMDWSLWVISNIVQYSMGSLTARSSLVAFFASREHDSVFRKHCYWAKIFLAQCIGLGKDARMGEAHSDPLPSHIIEHLTIYSLRLVKPETIPIYHVCNINDKPSINLSNNLWTCVFAQLGAISSHS